MMKNFIKVFIYSSFYIGSIFFMLSNVYASINISFEIKPEQLKNKNEGIPIIEKDKTTRLYIHINKNDSEDLNSTLTLKNINTGKILQEKIPFNLSRKFEDIVWIDFKLSELGNQTLQAILISNEEVENIIADEIFNIISDIDTDGDKIFNTEDSDDDNDGLTDIEEINIGSSPLKKDSDEDTILDGDEFKNKTNPTKKDSDGDGVHDNYDAFPLDPKAYLYSENNSNKPSSQKNIKEFKDKSSRLNNEQKKSSIVNNNQNENTSSKNNFLLKNLDHQKNLQNKDSFKDYKQKNSSKYKFIKKYILTDKENVKFNDFLDLPNLELQNISWSINNKAFSHSKFLKINTSLPFQKILIKAHAFDKNMKLKNFSFYIWIFHPYFYGFLVFIFFSILFIIFGICTRRFRRKRKK